MGNLFDEFCVDCHENDPIDGFRCFGCQIDFWHSEGSLFATNEAN